jgi:Autotransporter beta-domain
MRRTGVRLVGGSLQKSRDRAPRKWRRGPWIPRDRADAAKGLRGTEAPRNEIFAGFEASDNYASAYLGGGYAFGKGLYAPGWRLRSVASYGRYRYDGSLPVGTDYMATAFDGEEYFGSALVGYQFHPGASLIVKLFAGIESDSQIISPHDPNNSRAGQRARLEAASRKLDRSVAEDLYVGRRLLRHGLPAILGAGSARLSRAPAPLARPGGGRAWQ